MCNYLDTLDENSIALMDRDKLVPTEVAYTHRSGKVLKRDFYRDIIYPSILSTEIFFMNNKTVIPTYATKDFWLTKSGHRGNLSYLRKIKKFYDDPQYTDNKGIKRIHSKPYLIRKIYE
jgi:hypothetical protein